MPSTDLQDLNLGEVKDFGKLLAVTQSENVPSELTSGGSPSLRSHAKAKSRTISATILERTARGDD